MLCYAKSLQSCPTLCDPIDSSLPGSPVPGILQARTLEWVAISFSNAWKWKVKGKSLSHVRLLATPWTAAYQAPPSMGFSRQEYWNGAPLPSPLKTLTITLKNFFLPVSGNHPSSFFLSVQIVCIFLACCGTTLTNYKKSPVGNLIGVAINVQINCGKNDIFAMPRNKSHFSIYLSF